MLVLGIETSGLDGSVALVRDAVCLGERRLNQTGRRHAQALVSEIGELLRIHSLKPRDIECIAVSRGPGSFTGLRVGMVCAKTFAYATNCRFLAVDTFLAIAQNVPANVTQLYVIEDAQRDDLFVGEYRRDDAGPWEQVSPIRIESTAMFLANRTIANTITGPGVTKLEAMDDSLNCLSDSVCSQPRASVIAAIANLKIDLEHDCDTAKNETERDYWRASPFYLRLSAAEEKKVSLGR